MAKDRVQTGLRLDEDTWKRIAFMCDKHKRSLNAEIEYAVIQAIERYEKEYGLIPVEDWVPTP